MKKYIFMPAQTQSEWDSVSFALVELTDSDITRFKRMQRLITDLKDKEGVHQLVINSDHADFFISDEELTEMGITKIWNEFEELDACIIELSDEQFNSLTRPEQDIKYGEMRFDSDGITFSASGKHTGEEFFCEVGYSILPANILA